MLYEIIKPLVKRFNKFVSMLKTLELNSSQK